MMEPPEPVQEGAEVLIQGLWGLVPWLVLIVAVATVGAAWALWVLLARLATLRRRLDKLDRLDDLKVAVKELADSRGDLDLRRLEHVLIDIRDGQRRVEDALLRAVEAASSSRVAGEAADAAAATVPLEERVVNRLLAMGFERIRIVPAEADEKDGEGGGDAVGGRREVAVEARRDGVMHKGRVLVRDGVLADVLLKPAYGAFP